MQGTLTIGEPYSGQRLDRVLSSFLKTSRSSVQKHIKEGQVTVNAKTVSPHYALRGGDVVAWSFGEEESIQVVPNATIAIGILHEDEEKIVIEKPSGVVVHQGSGHKESDTVANWLLAHAPDARQVGSDPDRPGIVHRLDRDVSGVMVLAKKQEFFEHLVDQFARNAVEKEYLAIVYGQMTQASGTIDFPLARSTTKGWKIAARPHGDESDDNERDAVTHFETIEAKQQYSLLRVVPKTGRMHQIRAHLAAYRYPIVGDRVYAPKSFHPERAERLFLHATEIAFQGKEKREKYTSPLPEIFQIFIQTHA